MATKLLTIGKLLFILILIVFSMMLIIFVDMQSYGLFVDKQDIDNALQLAQIEIDRLNEEILRLKERDNKQERNQSIFDKVNIDFIQSMVNNITKETVECDKYQHKYIQYLLQQLMSSDFIKIGNRTTSLDIDNDLKEWKNNHHYNEKRLRVQIINHQVYLSGNFLNDIDYGEYRSAIMLYLHSLMNKYGQYISNTDFIWHFGDIKGRMWRFRNEADNSIPYIWKLLR